MKYSIKQEIAVVFIGVVAFIVLMFLVINNLFLEKFYILNKETTLSHAYETISEYSKDTSLSDSQQSNKIDKISAENNLLITIFAEQSILFSSDRDLNTTKYYIIQVEMKRLSGFQSDTILKETDQYVLYKSKDALTNSDYLEIIGKLDNGDNIYIRTPLSSVTEAAQLTNRFLVYIGMSAIFLSSIIIWFISKKITNPILELVRISNRMINLDFKEKYTSGGKNEIAVLGAHVNQLSQTLESTISELQNANNILKKDIEDKVQIDEMRKEFLSNVSHELKTPIAIIQGYAEGLLECVNDDEESRNFYSSVIVDESNKMNKLVKKLLTLNQLEFGNEVNYYEKFDLVSLIRGVIHSSSILAEQNNISISFQEEGPVYVWGDEFKIEEVVTNFLSNAIHHAKYEKKIEIYIKPENQLVKVSVFNTGDQIPEEDIDKVWVKFYKVDKARTREYGGSGIGLSIVKAILDSYGRKCGVQNHENGVEFWFEAECKNETKNEPGF